MNMPPLTPHFKPFAIALRAIGDISLNHVQAPSSIPRPLTVHRIRFKVISEGYGA